MKLKRFTALFLSVSLLLPSMPIASAESMGAMFFSSPNYTPYLQEQIRLLQDINENAEKIVENTKRKEMTYTTAGIFPINYWDEFPSDYQPPVEVFLSSLKERRQAVDFWETPTVPSKRYEDASTNAPHRSNLNYLLQQDVIHRDDQFAVSFSNSDPGYYTINAKVNRSLYATPTDPFSRSDSYMSLQKIFTGVAPSRPIVLNSATVVRDTGNGYKEVSSISADAYTMKDKLKAIDLGGSNTTITFPFKDTMTYINPNVYELYFQKAIEAGILSTQDFTNKQVAAELKASIEGNQLPRWSNSLKGLDITSMPSGFFSGASEDSTAYSAGYTKQVYPNSLPFGSAYFFNARNVDFSTASPTAIENKTKLSAYHDLAVARSSTNFFDTEKITVGEFYQIIHAYMLKYEKTLTQKEMDTIRFFFGATYTAPEDMQPALDYLIATGIINPENPDEINDIHNQLTNDFALELLKRIKNKDARYTLKDIQLTGADAEFLERGYLKNTIQVSKFDKAMDIETNVAEPVSIIDGEITPFANVFTFHIPKTHLKEMTLPPELPGNWYITDQTMWALDSGTEGIDYLYDYDEEGSDFIMKFSLTTSYYKKLKARGQAFTVNSRTGTDMPTYIGPFRDPGIYEYQSTKKIDNNTTWVVKKSAKQSFLNSIRSMWSSLLPVSYADSKAVGRQAYEITSLLLANNDTDLANYVYVPTGQDFLAISKLTSSTYPKGISQLVSNSQTSKKGFYVTQRITATSQLEAAGIAKRNLAPKKSSATFSILGYTKDGTTLIHESELAKYNIVKKYDKMLFNEDTLTPLLLPGNESLVMSGSHILKLPEGTVRAGVDGGDVYYNLDAISLIMNTTTIAKVYNNSSLIISLPNERKKAMSYDDAGVEKIFNKAGNAQIDATSRIKVGTTNYYSLSNLNIASNSVVVTDISKKFTIVMRLAFKSDTNVISDSFTETGLKSILYTPPAGSAGEKYKVWMNLHNGFMKEFIPKYKSPNYYLQPHFTILVDDRSDTSLAKKEAKQLILDAYKKVAGKELPADEVIDYMTALTWAEAEAHYIRMPNNAIFVTASEADLKWDGKHVVYSPKVEFLYQAKKLGELPEGSLVTYDKRTFTVIDPTTTGKTILELSSDPIKTKKKDFDIDKLVLKLHNELPAADRQKLQVKVTDADLQKVLPKLGAKEYFYFNNSFYKYPETKVRQPASFKTQGTRALTYSSFNQLPFLESVPFSSIPNDSTIVVYYQLAASPDRFIAEEGKGTPKVYPISSKRTMPDIDTSLFGMNAIGTVLSQVDKMSHKDAKVPVGATVYFGTLRATKLTSNPPTYGMLLSKSRAISASGTTLQTKWADNILPDLNSKLASATVAIPLKPDTFSLGLGSDPKTTRNTVYKHNGAIYYNGEALATTNKTMSNFYVSVEVKDSDFLVVPLLSQGANTFLAVGNLNFSLAEDAYTYNIMEGKSLNFDKASLEYALLNGKDFLKSQFASIKQGLLTKQIRNAEYQTLIAYTKLLLIGLVIYAWAITFSLKAIMLTTRGRLLQEVYDMWNIDLIKIASLRLWAIDSDYSFRNVFYKMFLTFLTAAVIAKI